jgi:hypothetical protein
MARKKAPKSKHPQWRSVILGAILVVALGLGLLSAYKAGATQQSTYMPAVATATQLEASRAAIAQQYLTDGAANVICGVKGTPVPSETFYKYLRVNVHNDRAVIRGCNDVDLLLAKIDDKWQTTEVNINLSLRGNPTWLRACDVTDIIRADTVVRSENSSIDADNLKMCQSLQNNKILRVQDL